MADPNEEKRRALIMAMARDMGRGKEFPAQSTGFRTPEAKMSQGDPPDPKGLEDTLQADDLLLGMAKPMAKAALKPIMAGMAGKAGNKLFPMAGPMHMSSTSAKVSDPFSDVFAPPGTKPPFKKEPTASSVFAPETDRTFWMQEQFAKDMGKQVDPAWQRFANQTGPVDADWLGKATARPSSDDVFRPQMSAPPSAHETVWMSPGFADFKGVTQPDAWNQWLQTQPQEVTRKLKK